MVLNGFDSVKALKVIAMENYSRRRKLKWLFEFFVFLFIVFHRSSLFSLAGPVIRHFFRRIVVVLNSHIFVFMFFHAMLFVVYSLSHLTDNKSGPNRSVAESGTVASGDELPESSVARVDDSVAEILVVGDKNMEATAPVNAVPIVETPAAEPTPVAVTTVRHLNSVAKIRGIEDENGVVPTPTPAAAVEPTPISPFQHLTVTAEMKRYRRTESVRVEENRDTRKFRRSKTETCRREGGIEPARFLNSVEEMDMEAFNRTVESFIAEQKLTIGGRISD